MDRPNEYLCETRKVPEKFTHPTNNPLFEFGGAFLGKRERNDIPRCEATTFTPRKPRRARLLRKSDQIEMSLDSLEPPWGS
jgi:hypothetical protein